MYTSTHHSLVDVVVPLYNEEENVGALCGALRQQRARSFRVILVDNGSTDRTVAIASEYFQVHHCQVPGSYAARNYGITMADAPYVLFTDADCIPDENWVETLAAELDAGADVVAGRTGAKPQGSLARFRLGRELAIYRVEYFGSASVRSDPRVTDCSFPTCNVGYRRSVFDGLGLFPVEIGGDVAFSNRAARSGFKCRVCSQAVVTHLAEASLFGIARKFVLYAASPRISSLQCGAAMLLAVFSPVVLVVYFLIIYARRESRAKAIGIPLSRFALFEAMRLILTLLGRIYGRFAPVIRVY